MRKFAPVIASALALALTSCGGGGSSDPLGGGSSSSSGSGGTGGTGTSTTYRMGNGSGGSFQAGMIAISNANLSAGGTSSLEISVVDQTGTLYTGAATTITLTSNCLAQGLATITASGTTTAGPTAGSVVTNTGSANATYTAKGCIGADVISASAAVASQNLTATGTVTVAAGSIGSIEFVSATPATIGLKGTGLQETSTVVFKVLDSSGGARPGVTVNFSLNTTVGGLSLAPASATTAADGTAQTVVSSGTVHTAVRVTANIASPALSTQSSVLTVTTGLPASNAFSLSVGPASYGNNGVSNPPACPNIEAWSIDGVTAPFTARLADRYNNPAPDGTAVAFNTNGGHIGGNCTTPVNPGDGTCAVTWTSANPRPVTTDDNPPLLANGRVTILATAIGEESFTDTNGDGFWESGEPFVNLGEPYRDDNENGVYDLGEYFLDFNKNGKWDAGDGTFKGITCTPPAAPTSCSTTTLAIGAQHLLIMSTSAANVQLVPPAAGLTLPHGSSVQIAFNVQDLNGNPVAAGSTINVAVDSSIGQVASQTSSFVQGCATAVGGQDFLSSVATVATLPAAGNLYIQVTSAGTKTVTTQIFPVTLD